MKTKTRGGLRTRRIQDNGGTLGAYRQIEYLVRTPAPKLAGAVKGRLISGSF
jgi:hypothetical protein